MIEFNKEVWVYGIWSVAGKGKDFLATLLKRGDTSELHYRFRYYKDDKTFDSDDEKNFYTAKGPVADFEKHLAAAKDIVEATAAFYGSPPEFVDLQCQGDDAKIIFELGIRDWCHPKIASSDSVS